MPAGARGYQRGVAPGGKHLMMHSPVQELAAGKRVELNLQFSNGDTQQLSVAVR